MGETLGAELSVEIVVNNNAFSKSTLKGVEDSLAASTKLTAGATHELALSKTAITDTEKAIVGTAVDAQPDILVVSGHNPEVEDIIEHVGEKMKSGGLAKPLAIVATNSIHTSAVYDDEKWRNCVLMPTQWDEHATRTDTMTGWTTEAFKTAMGANDATYHSAAAAAAGIAISHAYSTAAAPKARADLVTALRAFDNLPTFYADLKWSASGAIEKPMFIRQRQGTESPIVAPIPETGKSLLFPLSGADCWNLASVSVEAQDAGMAVR